MKGDTIVFIIKIPKSKVNPHYAQIVRTSAF